MAKTNGGISWSLFTRLQAEKDNRHYTLQKMRILCLQHVSFEGPAALADWAQAHGHPILSHRLYEDGELPSIKDFDCLFIKGGPINIYEESKYPWLAVASFVYPSGLPA